MPDWHRCGAAGSAHSRRGACGGFSIALGSPSGLCVWGTLQSPQLRSPALSCCQSPFSSRTLRKAHRKDINSRICSLNLHFRPCLKQVLSYSKLSLIFLPSCCPGKILSAPCVPPSRTRHRCLFSCSQEGLDNPKPKSVCHYFLPTQIRSPCLLLLVIISFPPL